MKKFFLNKWVATLIVLIGVVVLSFVRANGVDPNEIINSIDFSQYDPATVESLKGVLFSIFSIMSNPITFVIADLIGLLLVALVVAAIARSTVKKDERYVEEEERLEFKDVFSKVYIALIAFGLGRLITAFALLLNINNSIVQVLVTSLTYAGFIWLIVEQLKNDKRELKYTNKVALVGCLIMIALKASQLI